MSAATQIAIEEYLKSSFRPDREYVDGEIRERNLGEREHSLLQGKLYKYFDSFQGEFTLVPYIDWRVQVSPARFRVPDISVVRGKQPKTRILESPPYIAIEVLSPDDSWYDMSERIDDYMRFGVANIWIIDPVRRRASRIENGVRVECADLILATSDGAVRLALGDIFRAIDAIE